MSSESLISTIKHQASKLEEGFSFLDLPIKRTKALEFVSRTLYNYPTWNVATGNSPDNVIDESYWGLVRQAAALCAEVPSLTITETDLAFSDGAPKVLSTVRFRQARTAIASIFQESEPHNLAWEELLVDRYLTDEMRSQYNEYPAAMRPNSAYEWCQILVFQLEYDPTWQTRGYPWELWATDQRGQGKISSDLISLGRESYRECSQHSWDAELKYFCGHYDGGTQLTSMLIRWPEQTRKVLKYLMDHDGGYYTPE